jgi:hypothetical protein
MTIERVDVSAKKLNDLLKAPTCSIIKVPYQNKPRRFFMWKLKRNYSLWTVSCEKNEDPVYKYSLTFIRKEAC